MKNLTLEHIAQACQGIYKGTEEDKTREIEGISTDSRKIQERGLFVPIKGARADGHDLLKESWKEALWPHLQKKIWGRNLIRISR